SSPNAGAVSAAVLAGLAVSVFPESALRPGMRVLGTAEGYPPLPPCDIGLLRNRMRPPRSPTRSPSTSSRGSTTSQMRTRRNEA
ncbi:hypothetical protein NL364_30170, partial [Klebsiella pneumoniae]|nr:hypothetical protein [Klebsiella pneumoniae]